MAKDCYLEIDGKRTKLTDEQLKALGLYEEPKANPFERTQQNQQFYYIDFVGKVEDVKYCNKNVSDKLLDVANYCTDKSLMQQRALHETLNRLLWRFSMENNGDKIRQYDRCYYIFYRKGNKSFGTTFDTNCLNEGTIYFYSEEIAQKAIDDIVLPFMKYHPEFIW